MNYLFFILLFIASFGSSIKAEPTPYATIALQPLFHTAQPWRAMVWEGEEDTPARLCFQEKEAAPLSCFLSNIPIKYTKLIFAAQYIDRFQVIKQPLLLEFAARFEGGGSGALTQVTFWQYDEQHNGWRLAGNVSITEQGEYRIHNGLLLTSDAALQGDETHFARHRFRIRTYRYDPEKGFVEALRYTTENFYPSFDEVEKIDVLSHELPTIDARLSGNRR